MSMREILTKYCTVFGELKNMSVDDDDDFIIDDTIFYYKYDERLKLYLMDIKGSDYINYMYYQFRFKFYHEFGFDSECDMWQRDSLLHTFRDPVKLEQFFKSLE